MRRRLYLYVQHQAGEVGRDEAARAAGIARSAAAFHLEKLVEGGLLEGGYRRLSGRQGPGAGRPARVYRRPAQEVRVSVPPRDYETLARFLVRGLTGRTSKTSAARAQEAAREFGVALGHDARRRAGRRATRARLRRELSEVLDERGFDPRTSRDGVVRLHNCPFDALSIDHPDQVCPLNLSMLEGVVEGLAVDDLEAVLEPQPGLCCVSFRSAAGGPAAV